MIEPRATYSLRSRDGRGHVNLSTAAAFAETRSKRPGISNGARVERTVRSRL